MWRCRRIASRRRLEGVEGTGRARTCGGGAFRSIAGAGFEQNKHSRNRRAGSAGNCAADFPHAGGSGRERGGVADGMRERGDVGRNRYSNFKSARGVARAAVVRFGEIARGVGKDRGGFDCGDFVGEGFQSGELDEWIGGWAGGHPRPSRLACSCAALGGMWIGGSFLPPHPRPAQVPWERGGELPSRR